MSFSRFVRTIFELLFLCCFTTCGVKEISMDFPEHTPIPVINGIFKKDSTFTLTVTKTQPVLEKKDTEVKEALVRLFEDGAFLETMEYQNDGFKSTVTPKINSNYRFSVSVPEFEELSGEDSLPDLPNIVQSSFRDSVYTGDDGDLYSQVEITIDDPPNVNNYYELILTQKFKGSLASGEVISNFVFYDYINNDLVLQNEGQLELLHFVNPVFSDELFGGESYTLRVNYDPSYYLYAEDEEFNLDYDLIILLRSVSKNYYDYNKSLLIHLENQEGDIWQGVGQPTKMFTNIKNGFGIFAGYSQVIDTIQKQ